MADEAAQVGALIRERRVARGLSQLELAGRLGVKQQSVSRWEAGESLPRAQTFVRLAEVLGVPLDDLLGGSRADGATERSPDQDVMDEVVLNFNAPPHEVPPEVVAAIKNMLRPYFEGHETGG